MKDNIFSLDGAYNDPALPERFDQLLRGFDDSAGFRVERIVSCGQRTPEGEWCDQDWDEWVLVLEGEARLGFVGAQERLLRRGDFLLLPRNLKHRVLFTSNPCIWLAIHAQKLDECR